MTIISFNFRKIDAERGENAKGQVKISNNISIKDIQSIDKLLTNEKAKSLESNFYNN